MKAIVYTKYGPPDVLQLKEVEKPSPKENEILVKIKATTVTAGDIRSRSFTVPSSVWLPARIALGIKQPKKQILGMELAGEVESVGKDVTRFKIGDQIFAATQANFGSYAEYICIAEDGPVCIKPSNITYEEAAAIPIGARTALFFLRKAHIQNGQNILIYGASGSVGSYAIQISKYFGATVTGVCSSSNLELIKSLGADEVIDYTSRDFSTIDGAYDIIFEAVNKSTFSDCIKLLKENGTYINIVEPLPSAQMLWTQLTSRKKLILSQNAPETSEALVFLKELVEQEKIKVAIDKHYTFEEIVEAHIYVEEGHKKGNVVIHVQHKDNSS